MYPGGKKTAEYCGYMDVKSFAARYLRPLPDEGGLKLTIPEKPTSSKQRYVAVK
jgi:ATP-dependent DNA helicase RecG